MASNSQQSPLASNFRSLLAGLRWRIRFYIWVEGISLGLVWILATFLIGTMIDHLCMWGFAVDLAWWARGILLVGIGAILAVIFYSWIFRRTFVRLADHSMALLLERHYGGFHDSLVTAVEMSEHPDHANQFSDEMLAHTNRDALQQLPGVRFGSVFRSWPIVRNVTAFIVLSVVTGLYAGFGTKDLNLDLSRLYLLNRQALPQKADIEIAGVEFMRPALNSSEKPQLQWKPFVDGKVKVAKGSSVTLYIQPDLTAKVIPYVCTIDYRTDDGQRDTIDEFPQPDRKRSVAYSFNRKPFKRILSDIHFSVVGREPPGFVDRDDRGPSASRFGLWPITSRKRGYTIELVDNPVITETKLECVYPEYLKRIPATMDWTPAVKLAQGTRVTVRMKSNKPLFDVSIRETEASRVDENERINIDLQLDGKKDSFEFIIPSLDRTLSFDVTMRDADDIITEHPYQISIPMVEDAAPQVEVVMRGIGTAVTPDVIVPVEGKVSDDYDVGKAWIAAQPNSADTHDYDIAIGSGGRIKGAIDFKDIRDNEELEKNFSLKIGGKLILAVKAADKFDLGPGGPHVGSGDEYQLDIVSPDQLLAMLEMRESGMRQRLEQIIDEVRGTRDALVRVKTFSIDDAAGAEPDDESGGDGEPAKKTLSDEEKESRAQSFRLHIVEDAVRESRKSALEVLGLAASFLDIREELINNRIPDSKDRENRLKNEVADPLNNIGEEKFDDLDGYLRSLEELVPNKQELPGAADDAVAEVDDILLELDNVLQKLIKFETYNELLDIVRSLIKEQDGLTDETKSLRKKQLLED